MIIKVLALAMLYAMPAMASEFHCVHEKDTAPPLDPVADGWFQQARELSNQRLPNWTQIAWKVDDIDSSATRCSARSTAPKSRARYVTHASCAARR